MNHEVIDQRSLAMASVIARRVIWNGNLRATAQNYLVKYPPELRATAGEKDALTEISCPKSHSKVFYYFPIGASSGLLDRGTCGYELAQINAGYQWLCDIYGIVRCF
jgi:hypothetical protein